MASTGSERDAKDALSKLLQMGTVVEYQMEFEKLIKRVTGISESLLKSFYISGLKPLLQCTTSHDLWLSLKKAYAPHSTSREYTLKTQLLRIKMHGDETPDAYLNRAQEYADALATIGEPIKDKDLVMLIVSDLRKEYNGLKTTITARQSPTAFSELHALLSDHDYMLKKLVHPLHHMVHKPFMVLAHQTTTGVTITTTMAIATTLVVTTTEVVIMVVNSIGHLPKIHHVTPDLEAMDNSEAYYGDDALHVGNDKGLPILHIGS
ncbi:nucleotide-binding alpha-beta plait domain-containing protein [Tanacetum coccineum]